MSELHDCVFEWSDEAPTLVIPPSSPPSRRCDEEPTLEIEVPWRSCLIPIEVDLGEIAAARYP